MSWSELQSPEQRIQQENLFTDHLIRKKQYSIHEKELLKTKNKLKDKPQKDASDYLLFATNEEKIIFQTLNNKDTLEPENLLAVSDAYYDFFLIKAGKIGVELSTRNLYLTNEFQFPHLAACRKRVNEPNCPIILQFYYYLIELNTLFVQQHFDESLMKYQQIRAQFHKNLAFLNNEQKMHICAVLRTYLVNFYKKADETIVDEFFKFNHFVLEEKIFVENGILAYPTFINVFNTALLVKKLEYAQNFLDNYLDLLSPDIQEKVYLYCQANLHYTKGELDKVESLLDRLALVEWKFYILINQTLLKALFAKSATNPIPLLNRITTLERKLKTSKKTNKGHKKFPLFLSILKRLAIFRHKYGTLGGLNETEITKLQKIKKDIEKIDQISTRKWLKNVADSFRKH